MPIPRCAAFFVSSVGTALTRSGVEKVFRSITAAGIRTAATHPRIHDLRHSLAVRALIEWQRAGLSIDEHTAYLGHISLADTYWYYSDSRVIPMPAPSCS